MLQLNNVDKYFFRRKSNEIHVIDHTTLDFEEKGLVALLGPSGCGKTTLLNVIGGLDKPNSGQIYVNGQKITGRTAGKVDKIRNLNIGYIFQNYNLIDNMTVFENVAMVLKMVGIKDKEEIREKVHYALDLVGMYRYRNRYADMLSGGERQRVGIARAIVKNPAIIIADEPTGNLDSANTLEVMNIIRTIAKEKLVVLVTHEDNLARFYADRIIQIRDGRVVSDMANDNVRELDYRIENKIYLKDLPRQETYGDGQNRINLYNDGSAVMDIDIVIQNGNLFIRNKDELSRTEVVDQHSAVELVDDHYRSMTKEESEKDAFDSNRLAARKPLRHASIYGPVTMLRQGFKTVANYHVLKKVLLLGFFLSAIFMTYSVSNVYGILSISDKSFIQADRDYLLIRDKNITVEEYLTYEGREDVNYLIPGIGRVTFQMPFDKYLQTAYGAAYLSGNLSSVHKLNEEDLVCGRMPENKQELVVDRLVFDVLIKQTDAKEAGYGIAEEFLDEQLTVPNMPNFTIVGISDREEPCIYAYPEVFINLVANSQDEDAEMYNETTDTASQVLDVNLVRAGEDGKAEGGVDGVTLYRGAWPENDYEVMISRVHIEENYIGTYLPVKVNGNKLRVVGYYDDSLGRDLNLVNANTVKYKTILAKDSAIVDPVDKETTMQAMESDNIKVRDLYDYYKTEYRKEIFSSVKATLIAAGIVILISLLEIFLMLRASFLSRIKEVGTLRAIGVKKRDIYRMFLGEILAITTIASLPGLVFGGYLVYNIQKISYVADMYLFDAKTALTVLILLFAFNILFGLLPVMRTMVKRPAAILARTDVN